MKSPFEGKGFTVFFGLFGLVVAALWIELGFFAMLLICGLAGAGVAVGISLDRRMSFSEFVRGLFKKSDDF